VEGGALTSVEEQKSPRGGQPRTDNQLFPTFVLSALEFPNQSFFNLRERLIFLLTPTLTFRTSPVSRVMTQFWMTVRL
jgi:hypothetical protein